MSRRVLCKFFAQGACLKGERCDYSHDCKAPPKNICTFYQKGACTYGSRCRYEHVRLSQLQSPGLSSSTELSACEKLASGTTSLGEGINGDDSADRPLCSFAAAGECRRGVNCPRIHGDICSNCGKQCLHPFRPKEREEHLKSCEKKQKHMKALEQSQEIECNICFECVLSKPTTAERKFGILSECDHPFCISCIRSWRSRSPLYGGDAHSTTRSCPLCRKLSYFVIPSAVWYSSKEEKQEIVDNYKAKLRSIDCKHFSFGNGNCPFGSSCFYKHTVKPGSLFWNATHYPDFHNARDWDENELESTSDAFDMLGLQDLMERFNSTRNPTDDEQFDDGDSAEDLDDMMGEMMVLLSVLQDVDSSDSDDFY